MLYPNIPLFSYILYKNKYVKTLWKKKKLIKSKKVFKNWWDQAFKIFTGKKSFSRA